MSQQNDAKIQQSEIARFFAGKTLLVTGATGYMGKCVIEKLLRSCSDLKHIYVLMRDKKQHTTTERLNRFFEHEMFDTHREKDPDFAKKVSVLKGDLSADKLGLSESEREVIRSEVNIIIHNGANVKFDERVSTMLKTNVIGTKHMLELAAECHSLKLFAYNSTAYSHCYQKNILEEFYPSPVSSLDEIHATIKRDEALDEGLRDEALEQLLGRFPNIYTYTKAVAEDLVRQYGADAKCAYVIFRPSIVIPAVKEPMPGWCGNLNGPIYFFHWSWLGVMHVLHYNGANQDYVPLDYTINAFIAVMWDVCKEWKSGQDVSIYNYSNCTTNPLDFPTMHKYSHLHYPTTVSQYTVWYPFQIFASSWTTFWLMHILLHLFPGCLLDLYLILVKRTKPKAVPLFLKTSKYLKFLDDFLNGDWYIPMPRTLRMIDRMNATDQELFYCDMRKMSWNDHFKTTILGVRKFILKETLDREASVRKWRQLVFMHYGSIVVLLLVLSYWTMRVVGSFL